MPSTPPVTLQINLAPSDYRHARYILPHQIRVWQPQVDEVLLVVDLHRSQGRFAENWDHGREELFKLIESLETVRVETVDYGKEAEIRLAETFFGGNTPVPSKDFRGGPFYAYFFGMAAARHDHVLHLDSDMLFGGGSSQWLAEALQGQAKDPGVLFSGPLPGPPTTEGKLLSQQATSSPTAEHSHDFTFMSTRLFLYSKARFQHTIRALQATRPPAWRNRIKAWVEGNPCFDLPEHLFSRAMSQHGLVRREFLGTAPGMWHLHPPYRCQDFYAKLPSLIERIERGDIPEAQRGDHDINDSLVDWSAARRKLEENRWWTRWRSAR